LVTMRVGAAVTPSVRGRGWCKVVGAGGVDRPRCLFPLPSGTDAASRSRIASSPGSLLAQDQASAGPGMVTTRITPLAVRGIDGVAAGSWDADAQHAPSPGRSRPRGEQACSCPRKGWPGRWVRPIVIAVRFSREGGDTRKVRHGVGFRRARVALAGPAPQGQVLPETMLPQVVAAFPAGRFTAKETLPLTARQADSLMVGAGPGRATARRRSPPVPTAGTPYRRARPPTPGPLQDYVVCPFVRGTRSSAPAAEGGHRRKLAPIDKPTFSVGPARGVAPPPGRVAGRRITACPGLVSGRGRQAGRNGRRRTSRSESRRGGRHTRPSWPLRPGHPTWPPSPPKACRTAYEGDRSFNG